MDKIKNMYNQFKRKPLHERFLFFIGVLFFLLYFFMGIVVILWKDFPLNMTATQRILLGTLLIVYAAFRFFRLLRR